MAHYFSYLPNVQYKIDGLEANRKETVTDITRRFKIIQLLNSREIVYYNYNVQDGDRPDIIAEKFYGDSKLDWVVMLTNEFHDRYFDWVMSYNEFIAFIRKKYGSVPIAQSTVHHYEQIITPQQTLANGTIIPERSLIVDETTYNSLGINDRRLVSAYDQEDRVNESHRDIKLLEPSFITDVVRTARRFYR